MRSVPPLTWANTIGYGFGDLANNFVFSMGAMFLLNYYTDVAGIGAAAAGTLLAAVRGYNAFTDVLAGRAVDRTSTRWGRCRPYLLWGGLPLLLLSVAVFSVPAGWGAEGKLVYAWVTYCLLVTAYSFVNIPYGSLASLMTQVPRERARLSAVRTLFSTATFTLLSLILGPLVRGSQGADLQSKLTLSTVILAIIGTAIYSLCFRWTREIVEHDAERPAIGASLSTLLANRALLILCASMFCMLAGSFSMNASLLYFVRYVLGDAGLLPLIVGVSSVFGVLVSAPFVPMLVGRIGKKNTFLLGIGIATAGYLVLYFSPLHSKAWVCVLFAIIGVGKMAAGAIVWALAADTVEYGEWRTGLRIEGLTYSAFSFSRKCGQAVGGSIPAFLLAASGYVPNLATQSEAALHGMLLAVALVPALMLGLSFVLILFYPLSDARFTEITQEIGERRATCSQSAD